MLANVGDGPIEIIQHGIVAPTAKKTGGLRPVVLLEHLIKIPTAVAYDIEADQLRKSFELPVPAHNQRMRMRSANSVM